MTYAVSQNLWEMYNRNKLYMNILPVLKQSKRYEQDHISKF